MENFKRKVWVEYPIPYSVSIWGKDQQASTDVPPAQKVVTPEAVYQKLGIEPEIEKAEVLNKVVEPKEDNLDILISSCVDEVQSDILITDSMSIRANTTQMPEGTVAIANVKLEQFYQGNRYVHKSYDPGSRMLMVRYFPATVRYRRLLKVSDLDTLIGDQLIYVKTYVLMKMATKELTVLTAVKLDADNGEVNLAALESFRNECTEKLQRMKDDILIYVNG